MPPTKSIAKVESVILPRMIATLTFLQGTLVLEDGEKGLLWRLKSFLPPYGEEAQSLLDTANEMTQPPAYYYSPADGQPGFVIAHRVQSFLGGRLWKDETLEVIDELTF